MDDKLFFDKQKDSILLLLLPFWTPLIPPLGIASLKSFLIEKGYNVKSIDSNIDEELYTRYFTYINTLKKTIPLEQQSNYYNIVNNVWQDHLMATINKDKNELLFFEIIKKIIYESFYYDCNNDILKELTLILEEYIVFFRIYISKLISQETPKILGISTYRATMPLTCLTSKIAKEIDNEIKIVIGGGVFSDELSLNSPNMNSFVKNYGDFIDLIIIGEGEILLQKYLEGKLKGDKKIYTIQDINNEVLDLSISPTPDFSDFVIERYPMLTMLGSKSCFFQCKFCSETVYGGKYRKKEIEKVISEFHDLSLKHNKQIFLMGDSLLNPIINKLSHAIIKNDRKVYWDGYLRASGASEILENPILWRKGGFYRARIGAESGSDKVLKLMNKKLTTEQIKKTVINLASVGIKTTTYWVIGFPGETERDFQKTLNLIEELSESIYEADCNPYSFSFGGQVNSYDIISSGKCEPLYNDDYLDLLLFQTWVSKEGHSRKETFKRVSRFMDHCNKLGIINPYSTYDIYLADKRWKKLHANSVPMLINFSEDEIIDEYRNNPL